MNTTQTLPEIIEDYEQFRESSITNRRFKHSQVDSLIQSLSKEVFTIKEEGRSVEDRAIYSLSWGTGPVNILLWSQMHGDESTATMALFDIFNFLSTEKYKEWKEDLAGKVTLTFIPMLNPDGAERFRRRNALGVDLNRDALRLQSPEAQILKNKRDELNADFGFNLHDQGRGHAVGQTGKPATISFLAPAYNYEKDVNKVRESSMRLISQLIPVVNEMIPGHIAKYDDEFEPRAFGDNIQKWGTSLILIESGGYPGDREKQIIRKVNFATLLTSFQSIGNGEYRSVNTKAYEDLPFNKTRFFDLLIKNATIEKDGKEYTMDVGINQNEVNKSGARSFYLSGSIAEIGDLSVYSGYREFDANGMRLEVAGTHKGPFESSEELLRQGVLYVDSLYEKTVRLNVLKREKQPVQEFEIGNRADLLIMKEGHVSHLVMNGFLIDTKDIDKDAYGLDYR